MLSGIIPFPTVLNFFKFDEHTQAILKYVNYIYVVYHDKARLFNKNNW